MFDEFGFLAPGRLALLALPVALLVGYVVLAARRRRYALRLTTVDMLDGVAPDRPGWRRHVIAFGLVIAVIVVTLAFARPVVAGETYQSTRTVVLALDTSISMEAGDVAPSRIDALREAADVFVDSVPDGVAVGVVAFDGSARQLIAPTTRLEAVRRVVDGSINRSSLGEGTAIGEAVFLGIEAIEWAMADSSDGSDGALGTIVLLSDGETTTGRSNDEAATDARRAGIPVHTIAFGTDSGYIELPLQGRVPVPVNEDALKRLADQTGGTAVAAVTADQLNDIYEDLGRSVTVEKERVEIGHWFTGAAVALLGLAGLGSLVWFGRLP